METYIKLIFIFVSLNFHYNFHITPRLQHQHLLKLNNMTTTQNDYYDKVLLSLSIIIHLYLLSRQLMITTTYYSSTPINTPLSTSIC